MKTKRDPKVLGYWFACVAMPQETLMRIGKTEDTPFGDWEEMYREAEYQVQACGGGDDRYCFLTVYDDGRVEIEHWNPYE
jgi:hypothetical protein